MITILLVEDEPPILRDIQFQIRKCSEKCTIFATAFNGRQAIEILESSHSKIDLLITDIQMPVINGLELIQHVKKLYPDIICVILTGYSEFNYAKEALRLGVMDYLLKPVEEEALTNILNNVYEKKYQEKLENEIRNSGPVLSISSNIPQPDKTDHYATAVLCIGSFPIYSTIYTTSMHSLWTNCKLEKNMTKLLRSDESFWILEGKTPSEKNIIISFNQRTIREIETFYHQFFSSLHLQQSYTMAVQPELESINEVGKSIQSLRQLLAKKTILGTSQLLFHSKERLSGNTSGNTLELLDLHLSNLCTFFDQMQFGLFTKELSLMIRTMQKKNCNQSIVFKYLYDLMNTCFAKVKNISSSSSRSCIEYAGDAIYMSSSFQDLFDNINDIFNDIFDHIKNKYATTTFKEHLMITIDTYIQENYQQPLNTQNLSEHFNFSPAYLSKLFREYKALSPTEYITALRIDKAKELLLSSNNLKIKEVATLVGYDDSLYFSKVFKKITGISPKQFLEFDMAKP